MNMSKSEIIENIYYDLAGYGSLRNTLKYAKHMIIQLLMMM